LAAQWFDGLRVGGTTARRLNGLTVGDQLLDGVTVWRIDGLTDRRLATIRLDGSPVDNLTALQLGGLTVGWLDGSMA
jgi:hypothetical protein